MGKKSRMTKKKQTKQPNTKKKKQQPTNKYSGQLNITRTLENFKNNNYLPHHNDHDSQGHFLHINSVFTMDLFPILTAVRFLRILS